MQTLLAILLGKLIAYLSRFLKIGGGTAAPGLFALRIDPELVEGLIHHISRNVIITGTNGKTTTARMLAHFAKEAGLKVIRNHTGSNLERGIASALIAHYQLPTTNYQLDLGIWEVDEAAFNTVTPKIKPDIIVFLNVFRDQLDRYGEVDTVVKNWCETLKALASRSELIPQTVVLVNGDDANTAKLKNCFKGQIETFGVKDYKIIGEALEHVIRPHRLDFEAKNVVLDGLEGSKFDLSGTGIRLPIPGIYHIYDAVAAIACATHLGLPMHKSVASLKNFQPAFGRVEKLDFGYIFLIKNPAGATQVFETIAPQLKPEDRLLLALNDNLADGTDVSWIWDAGFEELRIKNLELRIVCSGKRAYDLAVRLKYAGFEPDSIKVEPNLENALKQARRGLKGKLFILPTYTAMLEIQKILAKIGVKGHYWEET